MGDDARESTRSMTASMAAGLASLSMTRQARAQSVASEVPAPAMWNIDHDARSAVGKDIRELLRMKPPVEDRQYDSGRAVLSIRCAWVTSPLIPAAARWLAPR